MRLAEVLFRFEEFLPTLNELKAELFSEELWTPSNRLDRLLLTLKDATCIERSRTPRERAEITWHYIEGAQWYQAYQGIRGSVGKYRKTFKKALSGAAYLFDERPANKKGRDALFELVILSVLRRGKLPAELNEGDGPDISVVLPDHLQMDELLVECKRPGKPEALQALLSTARKQFRDSATTGRTGIVAIDWTSPFYKHLVSGDDGILGVKVPTGASTRVQHAVNQAFVDFVDSMKSVLTKLENSPHVVGMIAYSATPVIIEGLPSPLIGQHLCNRRYTAVEGAEEARRFICEQVSRSIPKRASARPTVGEKKWEKRGGLYRPRHRG